MKLDQVTEFDIICTIGTIGIYNLHRRLKRLAQKSFSHLMSFFPSGEEIISK